MTNPTLITRCRSCDSEELEEILVLEPTPLADSFGSKTKENKLYRLRLQMCATCGLVQTSDAYPNKLVFEDYLIGKTAQSPRKTLVDSYVEDLCKHWNLKMDDLVLEIGSGDGSLLEAFSRVGCRVVGIEPSEYYSTVSIDKGIKTYHGSFSEQVLNGVLEEYNQFDFIIVDNTSGLQHPAHLSNVSSLSGYVEKLSKLVKSDGVVITRVPDLGSYNSSNVIDYFYHEHQSYFSVESIKRLFETFGLNLIRAEVPGLNEFNAKYYFSHRNATEDENREITAALSSEKSLKLRQQTTYSSMANIINYEKKRLLSELHDLTGKRIIGYGASSSSSNLICQYGLASYLEYLVDDNEDKVGSYSSQLDLKVKSPSAIYSDNIDVVVILAGAYSDQIISKHSQFQGKMISPYAKHNPPYGSYGYYIRNLCRLCNSPDMDMVLELTPTALCDAFSPVIDKPRVFPLNLCLCENCGFVQLDCVVDPEEIYKDYIFVTTSSSPLKQHFFDYAGAVVNSGRLSPNSFVVDIGSNDGTLLQCFKEKGLRTLGVEPAPKIAALANSQGIETITNYFNTQVAGEIVKSYGFADVITINNLFANIDDLVEFSAALNILANKNGVIVIESSYLGDMIKNSVFDFIYHEHLSYFSISPLKRFFETFDFQLETIEEIDTKGGSLRYYFRKGDALPDLGMGIDNWLSREEQYKLKMKSTYLDYYLTIEKQKLNLERLLSAYDTETIIGYGASATSTTLIYHYELSQKLAFLVDDNPSKVGTFSPGYHLPVYKSDVIHEKEDPVVLILAWRYAEEIMERHPDFHGTFIVPLPTAEVYR